MRQARSIWDELREQTVLGLYGGECQAGRRIEPRAFDKGRASSTDST